MAGRALAKRFLAAGYDASAAELAEAEVTLPTAFSLPFHCLPNAFQLHFHCLSTVFP